MNGFVAFDGTVIGSFASGSLLTGFSWPVISGLILVPVSCAVIGIFWLKGLRGKELRQVSSPG